MGDRTPVQAQKKVEPKVSDVHKVDASLDLLSLWVEQGRGQKGKLEPNRVVSALLISDDLKKGNQSDSGFRSEKDAEKIFSTLKNVVGITEKGTVFEFKTRDDIMYRTRLFLNGEKSFVQITPLLSPPLDLADLEVRMNGKGSTYEDAAFAVRFLAEGKGASTILVFDSRETAEKFAERFSTIAGVTNFEQNKIIKVTPQMGRPVSVRQGGNKVMFAGDIRLIYKEIWNELKTQFGRDESDFKSKPFDIQLTVRNKNALDVALDAIILAGFMSTNQKVEYLRDVNDKLTNISAVIRTDPKEYKNLLNKMLNQQKIWINTFDKADRSTKERIIFELEDEWRKAAQELIIEGPAHYLYKDLRTLRGKDLRELRNTFALKLGMKKLESPPQPEPSVKKSTAKTDEREVEKFVDIKGKNEEKILELQKSGKDVPVLEVSEKEADKILQGLMTFRKTEEKKGVKEKVEEKAEKLKYSSEQVESAKEVMSQLKKDLVDMKGISVTRKVDNASVVLSVLTDLYQGSVKQEGVTFTPSDLQKFLKKKVMRVRVVGDSKLEAEVMKAD